MLLGVSQGTGAVTLAAVMSAVGVTKSRLADQRFVIFGAGSAGLGIARQLRHGMATIDNVPPGYFEHAQKDLIHLQDTLA